MKIGLQNMAEMNTRSDLYSVSDRVKIYSWFFFFFLVFGYRFQGEESEHSQQVFSRK